MANLSNINNKFLVTTGGNVLIGATAAVGTSIFQVTGSVNITGGTTSGLNITTSGTQDTININRAASNDNAITKYQTASADKWIVGLRNTSDDNFRFYSYGTSTDVLTINQGNGSATFAGIITANSSSSGDYVRMYGSSGTGKWDIYGNGANLRISDNESAGILAVDTGATFGGNVTLSNGALTIYEYAATSPAISATSGWGGGVSNPIINFGRTGSAVAGSIGYDDPSTCLYIGTTTSHKLKFRTNNVDAITIDTSQKVGIGETSPSAKLHVKSTANADVIFKLENTNTGTNAGAKIELIDDEGGSGSGAGALRHSISSISQTVGNWIIGSGAAAGQLQFSTVDAFAMIIDEEQRVGIGTTLPTTALTIRKAIPAAASSYGLQASMVEFKSYYPGYDTETVKSAIYSGVSGQIALQTTKGFMSFWTSSQIDPAVQNLTEKMRIESNGHVGIGTTLPVKKLQVSDSATGLMTNLLLTNTHDTNGDTTGIAFSMTDNDLYNKAGIVFERLTTQGRGSLHFCNNNTNGSANFTLADAAMTVEYTGEVGIGTVLPATKLHVKDSQDSSLYSGLKVERSANTTGAYLNAVGGALNLNTDSSMPLKFRILNTSMQTINADGGRAYAPNASGLSMKEYGYNFTAANGTYTDLIENSSAHTDLAMVQISITAYHGSRTYFAGMGTFGGYGFAITGGGTGLSNGGLVSAVTGSGTRKIQWYNGSGYNATVRLYIQLRTESGITVLNGTLSSL